MPLKAKQRPPFKYHGAKNYVVPYILPLVPSHETYVEPFCGGASMLLNKPRAPVEVLNDVSLRITRFWRVLRDHPEELQRLLQLTPYSRNEFDDCEGCVVDTEANDIENARRDFVRWRQSFSGQAQSFSETIHRVRGKTTDPEKIGFADVVSAWLSSIDVELPRIATRIRGVQIINRDACEVIEKWDSPDTFHYCDPPYPAEARASPDVYEHEMKDDQHRELSRVLHNCKGKVILSGYDCQLYRDLFADWIRTEIDLAMHAAGGGVKKRATEVLWQNF